MVLSRPHDRSCTVNNHVIAGYAARIASVSEPRIGKEPIMHDLLAYIDPGSGSLIIQAVIATIVAVPFFFRQQIGRFVRTVRRTDTPPASQESGDSPDSPS